MRYKNGSPVKLYVMTDQESGDVEAFLRLSEAKDAAASLRDVMDRDSVIVTYVQEVK